MIKAVLLDMDNTLLANPDVAFARGFLLRLDSFLHQALHLEGGAGLFRAALKQMIQPRDGAETNTELVLRCLCEATGCQPAELADTLERFYRDEYPALHDHVHPRPGAVALIQQLQDAGYLLVLATNPLYPRTAIEQRMAWGGLSADDDTFALVTSADTMHFAKPDAAYYAEIIARVGVEPDEAIMLGDSLRNDIRPAQQIGIHTYQHNDDSGLDEFWRHLQSISQHPDIYAPQPAMIEPQLRGNIGALYGMLANVQPGFWHQRPDPDEWSIVQILCHLAASEEATQRPQLERILAEDNPFLVAPPPPGTNLPTCAQEGYSVAQEFKEQRAATLRLVDSFHDEQWQRPARHSIFGLTTMLEMAYFTAQHDRLHLNQLCQTIGKCE